MLRQVSPDLPDVVEGESTQHGDCSNVGCERELVIHGNPKVDCPRGSGFINTTQNAEIHRALFAVGQRRRLRPCLHKPGIYRN